MRFWPLVQVIGEDAVSDTQARVAIDRLDGPVIEVVHDIAERVPLEKLERGLRAKAAALLGEAAASAIWREFSALETHSPRHLASQLNLIRNSMAA
jgi:hypothetical protein